MNISMDLLGGVKFITNKSGKVQHIIAKVGCTTRVCHTSEQVAQLVKEEIDRYFKEGLIPMPGRLTSAQVPTPSEPSSETPEAPDPGEDAPDPGGSTT